MIEIEFKHALAVHAWESVPRGVPANHMFSGPRCLSYSLMTSRSVSARHFPAVGLKTIRSLNLTRTSCCPRFHEILGNSQPNRTKTSLMSVTVVLRSNVCRKGFQILFSMFETVADLTEIELNVFARHAAIRIELVLGVAPKAFDTVDLVPPLGAAFFLGHHDMVALHPKAGIGLPVVGVVKDCRGWCARRPGRRLPRPCAPDSGKL